MGWIDGVDGGREGRKTTRIAGLVNDSHDLFIDLFKMPELCPPRPQRRFKAAADILTDMGFSMLVCLACTSPHYTLFN